MKLLKIITRHNVTWSLVANQVFEQPKMLKSARRFVWKIWKKKPNKKQNCSDTHLKAIKSMKAQDDAKLMCCPKVW